MSQHIIRVTAEAFKNVKVIDFVPNRYMTKISGANGAGKTSALDAVFQALASRKTLPANFIRQGQKKGFLRIETNTHIITRNLDSKGGDLQIEQKGTGTLVKNPADWLEGITGDLGFDPLNFMRLKPEEQFGVMKNLVPMEEDVDDLETRNENDIEAVKNRRAEARRLEAARDQIFIDKVLPTDPIDIDALLSEARAVTEHNNKIEQEQRTREDQRRERDQLVKHVEERTQRINSLRAEIDRLEKDAKADSDQLGEYNAAMAALEPLPALKNRRELDEKISRASADNSKITTNKANRDQRERFEQDIDKIKTDMSRLEDDVRERRLKIARTLARAKFPVEGLSFDTVEEGPSGRERKNPKKIVTYQGIPLSEASTAEQIRVSTAVGMAGKPDLRFLLIREGSLLDDNGMAILEQMAKDNNWQILMEVVDTSGKIGIFMQEGKIAAVNVEPKADAKKKEPKAKAGKAKPEQGQLLQPKD
jgi:hypothetical protein